MIMRVFIDRVMCTGCSVCADKLPVVFEMKDEIAVVIEEEIQEDLESAVWEASELCPTRAISIEE